MSIPFIYLNSQTNDYIKIIYKILEHIFVIIRYDKILILLRS